MGKRHPSDRVPTRPAAKAPAGRRGAPLPPDEAARFREAVEATANVRIAGEEKLERSLTRLQFALETSRVALWDIDARTKQVLLSEGWAELLGLPRRETLTTLAELNEQLHPDDREHVNQMFKEAVKGLRAEYGAESRVRTHSGEWRWVMSRGRVVQRDANGRAVRLLGAVVDVSERKQMEQALRGSEARFRSLSALSSDWYWEMDQDLRLTYVSAESEAKTGRPVDAALGRLRWELDYDDLHESKWTEHRATLAARRPFRDFEVRKRLPDRTLIHSSLSGEPVFDEQRRFSGYRGIGRDITGRKRAEAALRASESRLRAIVDNEPECVKLLDADGGLLEMNAAGLAMIEADDFAAVSGHCVYPLLTPEHREPFRAMIGRVCGGERAAMEFEIVGLRGTRRWLDMHAVPLHDEASGKTLVLGITRDSTARKEAERAARRLQRMYAALSASNELIFRAGSIPELFDGVCRVAVEHGGFQLAAIRVLDAADGWLKPAAWHGANAGYLDRTHVSVNQDIAEGQGPAGRAARSGEHTVSNDYLADAALAHWHREAAEAGIAATACFPLRRGGGVFGLLILYSGEKNVFDAQLEQLLARMAQNLSFALDNLDHETRRKDTERALRESEARFRSLTELSSDWYWEQDAAFRFTVLSGRGAAALSNGDPSVYLGKARWETPDLEPAEGDWAPHRAQLERHESFRDTLLRRRLNDGTLGYMSVSGEPVYDERGGFAGYRGIARNFTRKVETDLALQRSLQVLENTFEYMDQGISIVDKDLRLAGTNRRFRELLDLPQSLCEPNVPAAEIFRYNAERGDYGPGDVEEQVRARVDLARRFEPHRFERERPGGSILEIRGMPVPDGGFVTIYTDITARARSERESQRFRAALNLSTDGIYLVDMNSLAIVDCNEGACRALGYAREELVGSGVERIFADRTREQIRVSYEKLLSGDTSEANLQALHRRKDGTAFPVEIDRRVHRTAAGPILVGVARDISERKRSEERLTHLAQFDTLTDLPNRELLRDRLQQAVVHAQRGRQQIGVLFIDLDRFKLVNDTLGHHLGDRLIAQVAERVVACLRAGDTVGRISGDEFAAVLSDLARPDDAALVARKILESFSAPFDLAGHETFVSASIGIAVYPEDGEDAESLLKDADVAMYRAKETGRDRYCFYTADLNQRALVKLQLTNDLRRAIERREFCLHYQPKIDLASGALAGLEALIRWQHPQRGLVPPLEFIPALEESGLIVQVGEWVIEEAAAQLRRWSDAGLVVVPVAVNLSARQFRNDDLAGMIQRRIVAAGIAPGLIELEITESFLMDKPKKAIRALESLSAAGLKISIDDFGTGYSSLAYLTRFPLAALKIDRSFVRDLHTGEDAAAVARAIIDMAHTLRFTVVAEGVETEAQAAFLRAHGCDQGQGYLFARPAPAAEAAARLQPADAAAPQR